MTRQGETQPARATWVLLAAFFAFGAVGCKGTRPVPTTQAPPANPSPAVVVTAPPPVVVSLPAPSGPVWTGTVPASLDKCCTALAQTAAGAPEPNREYMEQASETCERAVQVGQKPTVAIGLIAAALRGAMMPMACRH